MTARVLDRRTTAAHRRRIERARLTAELWQAVRLGPGPRVAKDDDQAGRQSGRRAQTLLGVVIDSAASLRRPAGESKAKRGSRSQRANSAERSDSGGAQRLVTPSVSPTRPEPSNRPAASGRREPPTIRPAASDRAAASDPPESADRPAASDRPQAANRLVRPTAQAARASIPRARAPQTAARLESAEGRVVRGQADGGPLNAVSEIAAGLADILRG